MHMVCTPHTHARTLADGSHPARRPPTMFTFSSLEPNHAARSVASSSLLDTRTKRIVVASCLCFALLRLASPCLASPSLTLLARLACFFLLVRLSPVRLTRIVLRSRIHALFRLIFASLTESICIAYYQVTTGLLLLPPHLPPRPPAHAPTHTCTSSPSSPCALVALVCFAACRLFHTMHT